MRVIARIPDVAEPSAPGGLRCRARPATVMQPRVGSSPAWPQAGWPIAVLAMIAVFAWALASRQEQARLDRQRGEMRVARQPAAPTAAHQAPAAAVDGAVVR